MEKKISACVIIYDPILHSVLAEHPTGRKYKEKDGSLKKAVFSLPKGEIDDGESKEAAAVREIKEETGLKLDKDRLEYLGYYEYLEYKDLEMFLYVLEEDEKIDLKTLKCESFFEAPNGKMLPEVNGFAQFHLETDLDMFFYAQQKVIKKVISDHKDKFSV